MHTLQLLLIHLIYIHRGHTLGCMVNICQSNPSNQLIRCSGDFCGGFKDKRYNGEIVEAVDISCSSGDIIQAPFDGQLYAWRPFGAREGYECADEGVTLEGSGQWQGYLARISSVQLDVYGASVVKGERIGVAKDRRCATSEIGDPYVRMQLFREGKVVDPTYHLKDCMCTGQICESNRNNKLIGPPFKTDSRYNGVRGWDILCPMIDDEEGEHQLFYGQRSPDIYSPIDAKFVGRTRLKAVQGMYTECDNNGVVLIGTGKWEHYTVALYNVHYRENMIGTRKVVQGEPIAIRLDCKNSPDSVFMEVRYEGAVVNITDLISAKMCKALDFPSV